MSPSTTSEQLSAYLDGELPPTEAAEVDRRLKAEPDLRCELDQIRQTVELVRAHGPATMPESVRLAIVGAVAQEPIPRASSFGALRAFGVPIQGLAVAAVALVVVGLALAGLPRVGLQPAQLGVDPAPTERDLDPAADPLALEGGQAAPGLRPPSDPSAAPAPSIADGASASRKAAPAAPQDAEKRVAASEADPDSDAVAATDQVAGAPPQAMAAESIQPRKSERAPDLYGGTSQHTVALRPQDLSLVAKLIQRHRARDTEGHDPATRITDLSSGQHQLALRLPDAAARNAFVSDVRRTFVGRHSEKVIDDGSLSSSGAQVALVLVVSPIAPRMQAAGADE